jgi:hypothetical protein
VTSKDRVDAYFLQSHLTREQKALVITGWRLAQEDGEKYLSPAAVEQWLSEQKHKSFNPGTKQ